MMAFALRCRVSVLTYTSALQDLVNLALGQPKTCSIIYVSVDTTQTAIESVAKNKPFLRMSLLDSSDFAAMENHDNLDTKKRVAMSEVLRDEDFITGEVSLKPGSDLHNQERLPKKTLRNMERGRSRSGSVKKRTVRLLWDFSWGVFADNSHLPATASEYVRPLSRAAITQMTSAYGTPSLSV